MSETEDQRNRGWKEKSEWAYVFKDIVANMYSSEWRRNFKLSYILASFAPSALLVWAPELP